MTVCFSSRSLFGCQLKLSCGMLQRANLINEVWVWVLASWRETRIHHSSLPLSSHISSWCGEEYLCLITRAWPTIVENKISGIHREIEWSFYLEAIQSLKQDNTQNLDFSGMSTWHTLPLLHKLHSNHICTSFIIHSHCATTDLHSYIFISIYFFLPLFIFILILLKFYS